MQGDFSRDTFHIYKEKPYKGVRMLQGRVLLDADWNENLDRLFHRIETETKDVIGLCGFTKNGFKVVELDNGDFKLGPGRGYVDGILCEIEHEFTYTTQPYMKPSPESLLRRDGTFLVYLDIWERLITSLEDPKIREVALGGPDTAVRSEVVWQVKLHPAGRVDANLTCDSAIQGWPPPASDGTLCARTQPQAQPEDPCVVAPAAGYKRLENQLYRVQIHKGSDGKGGPTYTWDRDNAHKVFKITEFNVDGSGDKVRLSSLGRDDVLGLHELDWVEVLGDHSELSGEPGQLVQVTKIDRDQLVVTLKDAVPNIDIQLNPKLRRWDSAGELKVEIPVGNDGYIPLEDGLEVKFGNGKFHTKDHWCIPARTIPGQYGEIEWTQDGNDPACLLPFGIQHHYCKLALIVVVRGRVTQVTDCRKTFTPLTELEQPPDDVREMDCCSVTVGQGGDYPSLQEAIAARPDQAESWSVCLLPGEHWIGDPIIVKSPADLILSGCGGQTRILSRHPNAMLVFDGVNNLRLEGLAFSAQARFGALLFRNCSNVMIRNCETYPDGQRNSAVPAITLLQCQNVKINENVFIRGGIQCLFGTGFVDIHRNQILAGPGPGIQLGAVDMSELIAFFEEIDQNRPAPATTFMARNPGIQGVGITENQIFGMQGSGILAVNQAQFGEVSHVDISHNQIRDCAAQPDLVLNNGRMVGGGIALSNFSAVTIDNNLVDRNGSTRACCGIFLWNGSNVEIRDNRVERNGSGVQANDPDGYQAGIAAFFILGNGQGIGNTPGAPTLRMHGNQVVAPAGLAFITAVMGTTQIVDNVFISQSRSVQKPLFEGIQEFAACVQIMNFGDQNMLAELLSALLGRVHFEGATRARLENLAISMPNGPIMFNDNQVTILFQEQQGRDMQRSLAASVLMSRDDVSLQGNQFQSDLRPDEILANVIVVGMTIRATGNNFRELSGQDITVFSYVSLAILMNITSLNTAENCILTRSAQKDYRIEEHNLVRLKTAMCQKLSEQFSS
jgi:hypothetical protein